MHFVYEDHVIQIIKEQNKKPRRIYPEKSKFTFHINLYQIHNYEIVIFSISSCLKNKYFQAFHVITANFVMFSLLP